MKKLSYVIRKDGMYLLNYQPSTIREFDKEGNLSDMYTCLWGEGTSGAKIFTNRAHAQEIKKVIDADAVEEVLAEVDKYGA